MEDTNICTNCEQCINPYTYPVYGSYQTYVGKETIWISEIDDSEICPNGEIRDSYVHVPKFPVAE